MHVADQFEIDWAKAAEEAPLREQWERNRQAQAEQWTTESMARGWAGFRDKEWWDSLPGYERSHIIMLYEAEQADLEYRRERWQPLCEVFYPDGTSGFYPPKPFRIRDYKQVRIPLPSDREMAEWNARVKAFADQLSADWSANRPPTVLTYDPFLASAASVLLGKKVEAIEAPHDACVPVTWRIFQALQKERNKGL